MQLRELVGQLGILRAEGTLDREVAGLAYDSRRVTPGMVFVAMPGHHTDGHDYILNALERGAAAIICERNGFEPKRATTIKVANAREAMARAAATFYQHPSAKLTVIGITGTNGKTTVAFMIKHILEAAGIKTGMIGTVRYEIGERILPAPRTTPEALDLQNLLAQMVRGHCLACVMEVSSHALDQMRVLGIDFDVVIFTNLTQDHLDYHGSMEAYFEAKKKLFTPPFPGAKATAAILNLDDDYGRRLAEEIQTENRFTYGVERAATIRARQIHLDEEATAMVIETPAQSIACRMPLIGRHNIYNALAAASAGLALGVEAPDIQRALKSMAPVPGRLERIVAGQPFGVFVDYAHTEDALRHVLSTVREITSGRVLLAFGCGGNRDPGKRAAMGKAAAELANLTIITSDNPRKESPEKIAAQIEEGFRSVRGEGARVELDRRRAIEELLELAQPGDSVLIAGKGHETSQELEDTIAPFDDRICAREILSAMAAPASRPCG